jgi:ribonuclease J
MERLKRWLNHFKMKYENYHASGHAPGDDITNMINDVKPKILTPIHTEHPEMFRKLLDEKIGIDLAKLQS